MFKSLIAKLFSRPATGGMPISAPGDFVKPINLGRAVQYPPQDPGFECAEAVSLVEAQHGIMAMLRMHAASDIALFRTRYEQPVLNVAEYISNLPGTSSGVFAGEGGLLRACIEVAFNSFRSSDGRIFTGASGVEERHLLEVRWRYVCFAAGLLYPIGAAIQSMQVLNEDGSRWSAELDSLQLWVGVGSRYWVSWTDEDVEPGPAPIMGMLVNRLIGRENINWLNQGSPDLIKRLVEIVSGSKSAESSLAATVVKGVWSAVHEREVARRHQNYGRLAVGSHISPYIIDAMVVLSKQSWEINKKTMFVDASGVHLEWPAAGTDIINFCRDRGYPGIPSSEGALLSLLNANKIIATGMDGAIFEEIANADAEVVNAVKLSKPGMLVDDPAAYAKPTSRLVVMADIVEADPLTAPSPEKPARKPSEKKPKPNDTTTVRPTLDTLDVEQVATNNDAPPVVPEVKQADKSVTLEAKATEPVVVSQVGKSPQTPHDQATSKEGAEIKYASLVDKDVADKLKPHAKEILGKVIHAWREKSEPEFVMRMTECGLAVQKDFILLCSSRGPDAILEWAETGLLYIDPMRPGVKIHQIATVEGGAKKVECIIFARLTAKLLGLT